MKRKLLSVIMALAMMLTLLPATAFAADETVGSTGIATEGALTAAITAAQPGDTVTLSDDINITNPIVITKELTLNLGGNMLSNQDNIWNDAVNNWSLISVRAGGDLTITGAGTLQAKENDCYAVDVMDGGICTIENGTFVGNIHAVYVLEGTLVVNGGTFSVQQKYTDSSKADEFVLNCYDDHYRNGSASILVTGGTFEKFNPNNCQAEGAGTSFMSADCKVAESTSGEVTTYTVTKNETITVDKPTSVSDGTVSATVGGESIPTDTGTGDVVTSDQTVTVDAKVDGASDVTAANVTVGGGALTAVKEAANVSNLAIQTNVGTLTVSQAALDAIVDNATVGGTVTDVTLSIKVSDSDKHSVTYDFTATDARGEEVFDQTASEDATITVTVAAPESAAVGETVYIYYIDGDTRTLEATKAVAEGGTVTWDVTHFSSREITKDMDEATYTNSKGNKVTGTLAEAVENAKENTTITLNRGVALSAPVDVDKQVTLDLNGHQITEAAESGYSADYLVSVKRGGDLTIKDSSSGKTGAITSNTIPCGVKMTILGEDDDGTAAKLTVDGGTIQGETYGIAGNGTRHNTEITINDGIIKTASDNGTGIYHPQDGSLTVNGGSITGNTGIEIRSGSLTVTGGTISGGTGGPTVGDNGDGTTTSNTGIAIAQHTTKKPITVNITGGTISGGAAVYESNPQNNQEDTGNSVSVTIKDAKLTGDLKSAGFGDVSADNVTVNGNVDKTGTGNMGITGSIITGGVTKGSDNSGSLGFVNSEIKGEIAPAAGAAGVTYVNTRVNGELRNTTVDDKEAMINGVQYDTLEDALADAKNGDVVTLLNNVTLDGSGKGNNEGLVTITKDITLDGNGKTITAENVDASIVTDDGPSMINIQDGANVTVRNLTIDGAEVVSDGSTPDATKHGLNIYGDTTTVTVENVTIKNGNGYAIVANGADVTVDGLITENNGWGGVNVDSKSGEASLTIKDADISESNSVKIENTSDDTPKPADPTVKIQAGSFKDVVLGDSIDAETYEKSGKMVISGGTFAGGSEVGAVDIADYLKDGLAIDGNGNVYTPSHGGSSGSSGYAITVPSDIKNGDVTVSPSRASAGSTVTVTVKPDNGYELGTLTVTDNDGDRITLTDKGNGKYTFTMPRGAVTVKATFVEETVDTGYSDVSASAWYADAVAYVTDNGMMQGNAGRFMPNDNLDRAMMAQILYNLEDNPAVNGGSAFGDVGSGSWYADAVAWASANSVITGYDNGNYGPNDSITREQMALMLYRYAALKGYDTTQSGAGLAGFADAESVSSWASEAMTWAVNAGVINGKDGNRLDPQGTATRAEVAQVLMNFGQNVMP